MDPGTNRRRSGLLTNAHLSPARSFPGEAARGTGREELTRSHPTDMRGRTHSRPSTIDVSKDSNDAVAGPCTTVPSSARNSLPCHGQRTHPWTSSPSDRGAPMCGHEPNSTETVSAGRKGQGRDTAHHPPSCSTSGAAWFPGELPTD